MLLSLGFVACDDMLPNPPAQSNPEVPVFNGADLTVVQDGGSAEAIDLNPFFNAGEAAPVIEVTKLENFPADYTLSFKMEIAADDTFEKTEAVDVTVTDNFGYVMPASLNNAIRSLITKNPSELTVYARFAGYASNGNATMRLGGPDVYYLTAPYKILPVHSYVVEQEYYLVGSFCDWDVTKGIKMVNADPSKDVYDMPLFSAKIDVTEDMLPFEWKVVPVSAVEANSWEGAFGVAPSAEEGATGGTLVNAPEAETEAGVISGVGPYLISINVEQLTYDVNFAIPFLYVAGAGTSASNFKNMGRLTTDNFVVYRGVAPVRGNFFFLGQDKMTGTILMQADKTEPVVDKLDTSYEMTIVSEVAAGTRFPQDTRGLYYMEANLSLLTLKTTHLETVSLVGSFNGWNEKEPVQLTHSADFKIWTGTVTLDDGEFKINTNNAWTIDFGGATKGISATDGSTVDLTYKGENFTCEAGTYNVTVSFKSYPLTIKLVKK